MLVIRDEQLVKQLRERAERENRPVEDMLKAWVTERPLPASSQRDTSDAVRRVRAKAYAKARKYWESVGDAAKAALTDEELDDQFGVFDQEGIPRLKSELDSLEPPVGSLAYAAKIVRETGGIPLGSSFDARNADDILNEEFADYLLKRMRGEDVSE